MSDDQDLKERLAQLNAWQSATAKPTPTQTDDQNDDAEESA
ncbi:hypothetical protein [Streptosporangium sp. NPDC020145]